MIRVWHIPGYLGNARLYEFWFSFWIDENLNKSASSGGTRQSAPERARQQRPGTHILRPSSERATGMGSWQKTANRE